MSYVANNKMLNRIAQLKKENILYPFSNLKDKIIPDFLKKNIH